MGEDEKELEKEGTEDEEGLVDPELEDDDSDDVSDLDEEDEA